MHVAVLEVLGTKEGTRGCCSSGERGLALTAWI